jgi:hypothetical protein
MSKFKEVLKSCDDFKKTTYYWNHNRLTHEENSIRNYPAPWIKKTVELLKIIGGNVIVEIGSTRRELTQNCISYHNDSMKLESKDAPPCCQDGHSTYFWVREGFDVYTVDIDPMCKHQIENSYQYHVKEPIPDNLHIHIPQDGIEFLKNFDKKIDLLFLDGWDVGSDNFAEKHLEAFMAAKDKLSDIHLISIDDTDFDTDLGGKDKFLTPYLLENNYIKVLWGRQTVYVKNVDIINNNLNYL